MNLKCYIGQTIQPLAVRWKAHRSAVSKYRRWLSGELDKKPKLCVKLVKAMHRHGVDKFIMEQLVETEEEYLNDLEVFYINLFGSIENGYNITTGGRAPTMTTEHRATLNDSYRKYKNELEGLPMYCIFVRSGIDERLVIKGHPRCSRKDFRISDYPSLDDAKQDLLNFLKHLEETDTVKTKHIKKDPTLPKGIKSWGERGYRISKRINNILYEKQYDNKSKEENRANAIKYLNDLIEAHPRTMNTGPKPKYN